MADKETHIILYDVHVLNKSKKKSFKHCKCTALYLSLPLQSPLPHDLELLKRRSGLTAISND